MKSFWLIFVLALAYGAAPHAALAAGLADSVAATSTASLPNVPPVLRPAEPADSRIVTLPGAAPVVTLPVRTSEPPPVPAPPRETFTRPEPPKPNYPPELERDAAVFCQKLIGQWKQGDAVALLGKPESERPAFDDKQTENGRILAFADPTGRFRQLELDFDGDTGALRTVFAYPWKMTWQDCRKIWGANVSAAEANKGRKFYSYLNRRLDVLVDPAGKVISFGLY